MVHIQRSQIIAQDLLNEQMIFEENEDYFTQNRFKIY